MELRLRLRVAALVAAASLMLLVGGIEDAPPADATTAVPVALLDSPASPLRVISGVDLPERPWLPGHRGVDVATAPGAAVLSPAEGVVVHAGTVARRGVVSVSVAGTLMRTTLEPVDPSVAVGDHVRRGDVVGHVSSAVTLPGVGHCAPAACLHWGLKEGETYLDPLDWTTGWGPMRLKPPE